MNNTKLNFDWTPQRIDQLKVLWEKKYPASEIAKLFSTTRNTIIGKLNTLKLIGKRPKPVRKPKPAPKRPLKKVLVPRVKLKPEPPKPEEPLHITLHELTNKTCKWPFGTGPYTFCGCKPIGGSPYCLKHTKEAFVDRGGHSMIPKKPFVVYTGKY